MGQVMKPVAVETFPLSELGLPTTWWRGIALFSLLDAALLLDYCANRGIAVLGVEGFRLEGAQRIPDLDTIADFSELMRISGTSFSERSISAMREFIMLMPEDDVMLEFVLVEP
jgi:hypothetical protein